MAAFSYTALDHAGKQQKGLLEADSARQVRQLIRERGWSPLRVEQAEQKNKPAQNPLFSFGRRLNAADLALFTRQLATLLRAAMPLEEALSAIAEQSDKVSLRTIILGVRARVLEGQSLAVSLEAFPGAFPQMYRAMVSAGERSGHLDAVMERLADHAETSQDTRAQVKLALMYPCLLLFISLLIVTGLMTFVVPQVVGVFSEQGQSLPWLTETLLSVSAFIESKGAGLLLLIAIVLLGLQFLLRQEKFRLFFDRSKKRLPILGFLSRSSNSAQFASTLGILLRSGVPLVDALGIAQSVVSNTWLRERLQRATQSVSEGGSLRQALDSCEYFSPMLLHMVDSGERSGALGDMLARAAQNEQRTLDNRLTASVKLFEPLVLLVMGILVFVIVLAVLQPIFELNQLI
jgi:general secretion pathway protein F